jgi:hypothetical protein
MSPENFPELWKMAIPLSTLFMAFASALFGFLAWRSEGSRRKAEARRARLEATIDRLAELFAAIPHDRSKWSEALTSEFVEKICKVDFRIDEDNPRAKELVGAIQDILPKEQANRDADHMGKFNRARTLAKEYLDIEWKRYTNEIGIKG